MFKLPSPNRTGKSGDIIVLELADDIQRRIPPNIACEDDVEMEKAEKAKQDKAAAATAGMFSMNFTSGGNMGGGRRRSSAVSCK